MLTGGLSSSAGWLPPLHEVPKVAVSTPSRTTPNLVAVGLVSLMKTVEPVPYVCAATDSVPSSRAPGHRRAGVYSVR
jgi:hypothetical protein